MAEKIQTLKLASIVQRTNIAWEEKGDLSKGCHKNNKQYHKTGKWFYTSMLCATIISNKFK